MLFAAVLLLPLQSFAAQVNDIRLWRSPDKTRLVFDVSSEVAHSQFFLENPHRLVLDIRGTKKPATVATPGLSTTPISKIRYGVRNKKDLRIVLDLRNKVTSKSFLLKPNATYGYRLVVDLFDSQGTKAAVPERVPSKPSSRRDIVVAIDAGHGGEDPGALAYGGGHEKAVTLNIAKDLAALLKKEPGFKPVLVRTGDYYIPLRERSSIARKSSADLFISIHADAFTDRRANGASVFALSRGGATSETARWLAQRENSSDQIGGEGGISLSDKDDILAGVLLDLSMTSTLSSSLEVGDMVLKNIGTINRLHKKQVEQAAFVVLKSPDIPSILVETGFISNPKEGRKLKTRSHQRALARQIHKGVKSYFVKKPPPGTLLSKLKAEGKVSTRPDQYVIQAGDTLSEIASRFDISLSSLKTANKISRSDRIRTGQVLVIPN
ncbi:N-acetylmuramoyl-L-alanine amidase [Endozoicomonas arenosclerae]|uniref:N-acetylmuramoyl-L-alanine amidase family protein n=1 Tax=Endozoicomonas arenosclerae TaxID=1633495 RepID=UPI001FE08DB4|nr:N-acetylmuramoyl-L-alanine amidase [Endozoicomonas arenosclerae]